MTTLRFRLLALLAILLLPAGAHAGDATGTPPTRVPMNDHFKLLHGFAGTWDATMRVWQGPGEPRVSRGVQTCRVVAGGVGISYDYSPADRTFDFRGHGMTTWNPLKKRYDGYWIDNFSHGGPSISWGLYDPKARALVEHMTGVDESGHEQKMKLVTKILSPDKHVITFFAHLPDGRKVRVMEITYVRRK